MQLISRTGSWEIDYLDQEERSAIRNREKDFANASDYEETLDDSDSITAVIVREIKILTTSKQHLHKKLKT